MRELEDATLTCCCSDSITLPTLAKSDLSFAATDGASCEMLEFDAETAGPGCTHATELNPVAASTHVTFKGAVPVELKEQVSIAIWVGVELDDSTSRPAEVTLESWPPAPLKEQPVKEAVGTRTALKPAPPDTTETLVAPATLQALKLVFATMMAAARDTATPPPRTAVKGEYCPAPLAEQFQKVLDDNTTEALLPPGISTDTPPPLLLEGKPTAPIATVTEQLLNDDDSMLTLAKTTLAWTAPPPPLAVPGRTDAEMVKAEHVVKLELSMKNAKLNPANFSAWRGWSTVLPLNVDTWGECSSDKAPPYTEVVPKDGPAVNETALQFVNELLVTAIRLFRTVVIPKDVEPAPGISNWFVLYRNTPATIATAPPIACSYISITPKLKRRA
jgi:hypothetical protein